MELNSADSSNKNIFIINNGKVQDEWEDKILSILNNEHRGEIAEKCNHKIYDKVVGIDDSEHITVLERFGYKFENNMNKDNNGNKIVEIIECGSGGYI